MNLSIKNQRQQALLIVNGAFAEKMAPIDQAIDDLCRQILKLPPRPAQALPYVGWMVGAGEIPIPQLSLSIKGLQLIASFEGCRLQAYLCPAKVWTIGYGHTSGVCPGQKISQAQAEQLFAKDLEQFEIAVRKYVTAPLSQNQYDALVSFCFNVGPEQFRRSTLLKLLNLKKYKEAALQLHHWVNAKDKKLPGLVRRRNEEYDMFVGE